MILLSNFLRPPGQTPIGFQSVFVKRGGIGTHMLVDSTYLLKSFSRSSSQPVRIRSSVIFVVTHIMKELNTVPAIAHHAPTLTANSPIAHQNNCSPKLSNGKKKKTVMLRAACLTGSTY